MLGYRFQKLNRSWRAAAVLLLLLGVVGLAAANVLAFRAGNSDVLKDAYSIPDGGGYCALTDSGVSEEIRHADSLILSASKGGTYCCGYTFAVVMKVAEARGLLAKTSASKVQKFQQEWYGATQDSAVKQAAYAMTHLGIGEEVSPEQARAGDFLVFNRTNKMGHSAILLNWMTDGRGQIVGIHYRSSQTSTNGVGDTTEFFSDSGLGPIDRSTLYIARLNNVGLKRLFS